MLDSATKACPRVKDAYDYISKKENSENTNVTLRTMIGGAACIISPYSAATGVLAAGYFPEQTKWVLGFCDTGLNKVWNKLDHNHKLGAGALALGVSSVVGGILLSVPVAGYVLTGCAAGFAFKAAADYTEMRRVALFPPKEVKKDS